MTSGQHISYSISDFLSITKDKFTGKLRNEDNQIRSWDNEYEHLQGVLRKLNEDGKYEKYGRIIFEYGIPSFNLVIDVLILLDGKIFVLEYKDGDTANHYASEALNQCRNYALRLKYFHNTSNEKWIIPILIEMNVQGLELDYATVMWDADFRYNPDLNDWEYFCFDGKQKWSKKDKPEQDIKRFYMKNAYRVLLTRARLGMIIMVPQGEESDKTRDPQKYDGIYKYLKEIGLKEV